MADTVQNGNWIVIKTLANLKVFKAVKGRCVSQLQLS